MVGFTIQLMGKRISIANWDKIPPHLTSILLDMALNNIYALLSSLFDLILKAISVLLNEIIIVCYGVDPVDTLSFNIVEQRKGLGTIKSMTKINSG